MTPKLHVRRHRRRLMLAAAAALTLPFAARSQTQARRQVRIIVAQTPGTTADILARAIAPRFADRWGQPFIVENRPGASATIGMNEVAGAAPDGHTLIVNVSSTLAVHGFVKGVSFDILKSFQPLGYIGSNNMALAVNASVPATNVREYLAWVRSQPKAVHYASPGNGTHHHLFMELLKAHAGLDMIHVPFKGLAGANLALLSGEIPTMFTSIHTASGWVRDGKVRLLGGTMRERHPMFQNLPSLHEQGIRGFDAHAWYALWGPAGMPADLVGRYNATLREVLQLPEMSDTLAKQGIVVAPGTPEDLMRMARAERDTWDKLVRDAGIKPD